MSPLNRAFQERLFESLLGFNSDDFRRLVMELQHFPDDAVNDLIFGDYHFSPQATTRLIFDALRRPGSIVGHHVILGLQRLGRLG